MELFLAFCPVTEVLTADGVKLLPLWLWFVKGRENPAQHYVIFLSLDVVLIFLCCRRANSVFSFYISHVFLYLYLLPSFVAFILTRGRAEIFQFMWIERQQWFCPAECLLYIRPVLFWPKEWKQNVNLKVNLDKKKKKNDILNIGNESCSSHVQTKQDQVSLYSGSSWESDRCTKWQSCPYLVRRFTSFQLHLRMSDWFLFCSNDFLCVKFSSYFSVFSSCFCFDK